jgi:hypothetical protein
LLDAMTRQLWNSAREYELWRSLTFCRRHQQRDLRCRACSGSGREYAMLGSGGTVLWRRACVVLLLLTVVMSRMLIMGSDIVQELRRESVRADLKRKRPVGRRHEAGRDERANADGHQQHADEPLTMNRIEETAAHAMRPE